jgi:hypothetical protein
MGDRRSECGEQSERQNMNVKIMGADAAPNNVSGSHYVSTLQASTKQSRLYKVSYTNLSGGTIYLWVFDTATGSAASAGAIMSRACPAGLSDTWDFYAAGKLFKNGIYLAVSTAAPANPTSTVTDAGNDAAMISADVRVG